MDQRPTAIPVVVLDAVGEPLVRGLLVVNPADAKKLPEAIPLTQLNLVNGRAKLTLEAALFQF